MTYFTLIKRKILVFLFNLILISNAIAAERVVNLTVNHKTVNFGGVSRSAIVVNQQIPGPTLHFNQGDRVTIHVCNQLDKPTSIHWHGILVPWQMDGVEGVSQKGIPPGCSFNYQFTLHQAGTYWYHAHAGLQEQEGLYGAFIIDPAKPPPYVYQEDYVVVLSDWSNIPAENVFANLKKDGDYYSPRFPLQPSLMKFLHDYQKACFDERKKLIEDYQEMQQMRMSLYDLSDVAYDAYLLNGHVKPRIWRAPVNVGDVVRLRFIGAAGSTIYRIKIPCTQMKIVHVQGNDARPYNVDDFYLAPGETCDVLVKILEDKPYIIYAEAIDTLGKAYGALVTHPHQCVNYQAVCPFPEPLPVTREMMSNMMSHMHHASKHKNHQSSMHHTMDTHSIHDDHHHMDMQTEATILGDKIVCHDVCSANHKNNLCDKTTSGTKYQNLIAAVKTNDPKKPINGIIQMELFGYMNHFIWFINGLPEYKAHPIHIGPGKRYRIIFTNNSMMRHPMHIHGHWFILRNGHGVYDPLLHTIEVPPGATAVADVDADASGQWFFHCHHIYHMIAGMARVFQYETIFDVAENQSKPECYIKERPYLNRPIVREDITMLLDCGLVHHPMAHQPGWYRATWLEIGEDPFNNVQQMTFKTLLGPDYHKLELYTNDAEIDQGQIENADIDIFYWHLISQFWAVKGGVNYFYRPAKVPYWQPGIGIEGLMPYFIDTDVRIYFPDGSTKFDVELSRDTQITNNFFIRSGIRSIFATKTVSRTEIGSGLNQMRYTIRPYYRIAPGMNLFVEYEHESDYGAFKQMLLNKGDPSIQNTVTLGVGVLF